MRINLIFWLLLSQLYRVAHSVAISKSKGDQVLMNQIDKLRSDSHSWSKMMLDIAEIQIKQNNPIDSIREGVSHLLVDLNKKYEQIEEQFLQSTNEHNLVVSYATKNLNHARSQIDNIKTSLQASLIERRNYFQLTVSQQLLILENSNASINELIQSRQQSHEDWQIRSQEQQDYVSSIQKITEMFNDFKQEQEISDIQISNSKNAIFDLQKRFYQKLERGAAKSLMELATKEFNGTETVENVIKLLQQIQENIIGTFLSEKASQEKEEKNQKKIISQTKRQIQETEASIEKNKSELSEILDSIEWNEDIILLRQNDISDFQGDLDLENAAYSNIKESYQKNHSTYKSEIAIVQQVLEILSLDNVASYFKDRDNEEEINEQV